jgi:octaprenyl-diphosphate synthase
MDYGTAKMIEYRDEAMKLLYEFPNSEARNSIEQLIEFTIERKI